MFCISIFSWQPNIPLGVPHACRTQRSAKLNTSSSPSFTYLSSSNTATLHLCHIIFGPKPSYLAFYSSGCGEVGMTLFAMHQPIFNTKTMLYPSLFPWYSSILHITFLSINIHLSFMFLLNFSFVWVGIYSIKNFALWLI